MTNRLLTAEAVEIMAGRHAASILRSAVAHDMKRERLEEMATSRATATRKLPIPATTFAKMIMHSLEVCLISWECHYIADTMATKDYNWYVRRILEEE